MQASANDGGGSFRDLRTRHLPLFDESVHRHDRGWPHPERVKQAGKKGPKKSWKTIGIVHLRHHEENGGQGEAGNGGSC